MSKNKYGMHYDGMEDDLKKLLRIKSVMADAQPDMPFGKETFSALEYMLKLGEKFGFKTKNVDGYAGHIEWGEGEEIFGVLCHLDVVPSGEGWTYPPFEAVTENGKIYARGALDDKAPTMAVLYAAKRLKEEGFVPQKKFRLILGLNEESGWKCMDYYLSHEEKPLSGFSPDADFPVINREKGVLFIKVTFNITDKLIEDFGGGNRVNMVPDKAYYIFDGKKKEFYGKSAHGSCPHKGDNAVIKMFNAIAECSDDTAIKDINKYFCGGDLSVLGLDIKDEESGSLTMNLGLAKLSGGKAELSIDIRFPVTYDRNYVEKMLKENLPQSCNIEAMGYHRPLFVPENDSLVQNLLAAYNKVTGENGKCISIGGATYARALDKCVAFGPVFPDQESSIHTADECIEIDRLYLMTEIYYEALKALL